MAYTKRELKNLLGGEVEDTSAIEKAWNFLMSKLPPTEQDTVDRLLAEQNKKDWDSMGERLDLEGISAKVTDMEDDPQDMLDTEGSFDSLIADSEYGKYRTPDNSTDTSDLTKRHNLIGSQMTDNWDSENQAPIRQNERELSAPSAPAKSSPASKMSPQAKSAMVGLLKEFLTPAPDDAPPQVRGAGIIRGGGTPFPSLLQKKPERKYYENKGLV